MGFIHHLDFARRVVIVDRGVCSTCTYTVFMCAQMSVVQAVRSSPSVYIYMYTGAFWVSRSDPTGGGR